MADGILVLDSEAVAQVLEMEDAVAAVRRAFTELAAGRAINAPRVDTVTPSSGPGEYHAFKTMVGVLAGDGVTTLRVKSDYIAWPEVGGKRRRFKLPATDDNRYVGYVTLFLNGVPVAQMPDEYVSRTRVGATSGVAADHLARADATSVGLVGTGWQAEGQLLALAAVRDLERVDVFSPTRDHREAFAAVWNDAIDAEVRAVESVETAVSGKDIVNTATNTIDPIVNPDWLEPGVHVSCVKKREVPAEAFDRADVAVLASTTQVTEQNVVLGGDGFPETERGWWTDRSLDLWDRVVGLEAVVAGSTPGRREADEATLFVNNVGLGIQFAAVGKVAYDAAVEAGLGERRPLSAYVQTEEYMGNTRGGTSSGGEG